MIMPMPEPIKNFDRSPMVWTIFFLNLFIYILIFTKSSDQFIDSSLLDESNLKTTGKIYYQYYKENKSNKNLFPSWFESINPEETSALDVLGALALRDKNFINNYDLIPTKADPILIQNWKDLMEKYKSSLSQQLLFRFGLSSYHMKPLAWITYQFSHAGWLHLLSNMIFLIFIGIAVESLIGSSLFLILYLLGGLFGGLLFLILNMNSVVPMVGASASISALLSFYVFYERKSNISYIFVLRPFKEQQAGIDYIYLPRFLIIPMFIISDISGLLSSPNGLGGSVAYAAHVGGAFLGLILAIGFRVYERMTGNKVYNSIDEKSEELA